MGIVLLENHWEITSSSQEYVKVWAYKPNPVFSVGIRYDHGDQEQYVAVLLKRRKVLKESEPQATIADARRIAQHMMNDVEKGLIESKLEESSFEEYVYNPNGRDTKHWMLDFYMLNALPDQMGKADKFYRPMSDELQTAIKYAKKSCYVNLKYHLLDATLFALCAEYRHCYDRNDAKTLKDYYKTQGTYTSFFQPYSLYYLGKISKADSGSKGVGHYMQRPTSKPTNMQPHENDEKGYRSSYEAVKHSGVSDATFADIAERSFKELQWSSSYGGPAWAAIAKAWTDLNNVPDNDLDKLSIYIDHIYDLEHNTGTMLNKLKSYYYGGSCAWIKRELDFKASLKNLYEFFDKISPDLKAFAAHVIYTMDGTTLESYLKEEKEKADKEYARINTVMNKPEAMYQQSGGKFSVGDNVTKSKPYSSEKYCKHSGSQSTVPIGSKGKVKKVSGTDIAVEFDNGVNWTLDASELTNQSSPAQPQGSTPGKFKVGDKVVVNNKTKKIKQQKFIGKQGVIVELFKGSDPSKQVAKVSIDGEGGKTQSFFVWKLDLVGAPKDQGFAQTQSGSVIFTKGEKVQYTGNKKEYKGKIGTIITGKQMKYSKTGQMMVKVIFPDDPGHGKTIFVQNLKKVGSEQSTAVEGNIKVGDFVKVTMPGQLYSGYRAWAKDKGLIKWDKEAHPVGEKSGTFRVVAVGNHMASSKEPLVGIEAPDGKQYIYAEVGLKKVDGDDEGTAQKPKEKFKNGDKVVLVKPEEGDEEGAGFSWVPEMTVQAKAGIQCTVETIDSIDYIKVESAKGNTWTVKASWIKKIAAPKPEEQSASDPLEGKKFEVGQEVRFKSNAKETPTHISWEKNFDRHLGKVGTIKEIDTVGGKTGYDVEFEGGKSWWLSAEWLEPAEEEYKKPMTGWEDEQQPKETNPDEEEIKATGTAFGEPIGATEKGPGLMSVGAIHVGDEVLWHGDKFYVKKLPSETESIIADQDGDEYSVSISDLETIPAESKVE